MTGEAWNCPHCGERILRSALTCPACQRHLRFDAVAVARPVRETVCPLSVDGTIRHPGTEPPWEYSVLIEIHDERGEMVARRVVGVGALRSGEGRKFTLRVEVLVPESSRLTAASGGGRPAPAALALAPARRPAGAPAGRTRRIPPWSGDSAPPSG